MRIHNRSICNATFLHLREHQEKNFRPYLS